MQDLKGGRPTRLAVSAKQEGGLQHPGLPMRRIDPEDILDRRSRLVERLHDPGAVLEFHVVLDLPPEQICAPRFPRLVGEANRPREVRDDVQLARRRVLGLFRLRLFDETEPPLELPLIQRGLRLLDFRRRHDRDAKARRA